MTNKNLDREGGEKCNDCDGDGFHVVEVLTASGVQENGGPCPTCDGTGKRQPQAGAAMPSDDLRTFLLGHITATELHGTKFERLELAHNDVWVLRQMLEAPTATATKQTDTGAVGAGEVKTWQERVDGDFLAYWKRRGYNPAEGAMMAEIADLRAQLARQRQGSKPTDLSKSLRASAARPTVLSDSLRADLIAAADEIERYYGGMLAWKRTAEAKDRDFVAKLAEVREHQQRELAAAIHYPDCWDTAAYPTVESALRELYGTFKCSTEECPAAQPEQGDAVRDAKDAARYRYIRDTKTLDAAIWEALEGNGSVNESGELDQADYAAGMDRAIDAALRASNTEGKEQQ